MRIRVQRQEKVGLGGLGARHAFAQGHEIVGAASQQDAIAAAGQEFALEVPGDSHDHGLFLGAPEPQGAWVAAAVAGIQKDELGPRHRRRLLHRLGRRRIRLRLEAAGGNGG